MQMLSHTFTFFSQSKNLQVHINITTEQMTIIECNKKGINYGQFIIPFSKLKYSVEWKINLDNQLKGGSIKSNSNLITQFEGLSEQLQELLQAIEGKIAFEKNLSSFTVVQQIKQTRFSDILLINSQYEQRILKILDGTLGLNELQILKLLKTKTHPNVLSLKNYWTENHNSPQYFIEIQYKSGGTLQDMVDRYNGQVPSSIVKNIMMQLLEGLQHLHSLNIIHRDIKFDNIVLDSVHSYNLYIIDFGLSIIGEQYKEQVGTEGYIAPETFDSYLVTKKQDIFSLGVVFHRLLFNQGVFSTFEENRKGLIQINQNYIDSNARELLQNMLELDPNIRFTAQDCLSSSYFLDEDNQLPQFIEKLKFNKDCNYPFSNNSTQIL